MKRNSPCMGCSDRNTGCHSKCEKYKKYKNELDEEAKEAKGSKDYSKYSSEKNYRLWKRKR